ncbi:MAG: hypothetical protein ACXWXV_13645, partial [Aeromicrobium sp.]
MKARNTASMPPMAGHVCASLLVEVHDVRRRTTMNGLGPWQKSEAHRAADDLLHDLGRATV